MQVEKSPFERLDIRVGKILSVDVHPDAESLYLEKVDVGEDEPRTIISGLRKYCTIEEISDQYVLVLCNLKPRKMRGIVSHGMLLCASTPFEGEGDVSFSDNDDFTVEIMSPTTLNGITPGMRVQVEGFDTSTPDSRLNPKKKLWEKCAPDMKSDDLGFGCYQDKNLYVDVGDEGTEGECVLFAPKTLKQYMIG